MAFPAELVYSGEQREFQFRDKFVMPLLVRLGFGIVVNYHGTREFGRDVIFGDLDRFGHVVYFGMQIKYESSVALGDSHGLAQDAEEATHNPFRHPQTGREEYISGFYVANAGAISDPARENVFNVVTRRGIRDAKLLDGNALVLLDKAAALNRMADIRSRLTGLLQEIRRNLSVLRLVERLLANWMADHSNPYPLQRFRNTATGNYLTSPFPLPSVSMDAVDQYWETIRIVNDVIDSLARPLANEDFRQARYAGLPEIFARVIAQSAAIDGSIASLLNALSEQRTY